MKLSMSPSSLVVLTTVFTLARANFDIYYAEIPSDPPQVANMFGSSSKDVKMGFRLFNNDPADCGEVASAPLIPWQEDFNGDLLAITCNSGATNGASGHCAFRELAMNRNAVDSCVDFNCVDSMEMHFSITPLYSWTIRKDNGWKLEGPGVSDTDHCMPFPNKDLDCHNDPKGLVMRKFRCLTAITATQINEAFVSNTRNDTSST